MASAADLTRELKKELAFTPEELKELERARTMPITFDEDCPETTIPANESCAADGELRGRPPRITIT